MLNRKEFLQGLAAAVAAVPLLRMSTAVAGDVAAKHAADMDKHVMKGNEIIAMLLYPQFTALDLVGPQYFFASLYGATVHLVAADASKPIMSDTGLAIQPTADFITCPKDLTVLFVPGGSTGTLAAMQDPATMAFLQDRGSRAKYLTSACTGSLLLGAAGLLKGYNATSHWVTRDVLRLFDAKPVAERVVVDRNRITAAGVSAGLDLGLRVTDILRGKEYAEQVQLLAEYDPKPHLHSGNAATAPAHAKTMLTEMFAPFVQQTETVAKKVYLP